MCVCVVHILFGGNAKAETETYALNIHTMGYLNLDNTRSVVAYRIASHIYIPHLISFVFRGFVYVCFRLILFDKRTYGRFIYLFS